MNTDNKILKGMAIEWFNNIDEWGYLYEKHPKLGLISIDASYPGEMEELIKIYLSEHPQEAIKEETAVSVVSLEDAALLKYPVIEGLKNIDLDIVHEQKRDGFILGANWQKEQYRELISAAFELAMVAQETTKDLVALEGAELLDSAIDKVMNILNKYKL